MVQANSESALETHARELLSAMTLTEKTSLCSGKDFWTLKGIERLGLPSIMVSDGPHGLRKQNSEGDHLALGNSVPATCFPTASALACTWDKELIKKIGIALGEKAAKENVSVLLGPGINIKRHSNCGRNFEYFSEDPLLSGELAASMVQGTQSTGIGSSLKHFAVNNQEANRMVTNAVVDERTLREIYLKAFETVVKKAQPWTIMSAYNRLNGTYCSEHHELLTSILRDEWGFEGLLVTDWGAMNNRVKAVKAGLDLEMPGNQSGSDASIEEAVKDGSLAEAELDKITLRVIKLILQSTALVKPTDIDEQTHHQLARKAAAASAVLLKNEGSILPLKKATHIGVIGEFAKKPRYQGTGSSQVNPIQLDSVYDALSQVLANDQIPYAAGYDSTAATGATSIEQFLIDEAVKIAEQVEVPLIFVGLPGSFEAESFDRDHMDMPEQHNQLIKAVCEANPNAIVILSNGAAVAMPWVDQPKAILESWLAGQAGGYAITDVIYGDVNPSGKLAETFPLIMADQPSDAWFPGAPRQVEYREGLYVGYRYFNTANAPVLFPFGHGLSYTQFDYSDLNVEPVLNEECDLNLSFTITNSGQHAGHEIVQVYLHDLEFTHHRPAQELAGFEKIWLESGESRKVNLTIPRRSFAYYDTEQKDWIVEAGDFEIQIAASSRDIRLTSIVNVLSKDVPSKANPVINTAFQNIRSRQALIVDEKTFETMLGSEIPEPEPARPFHINSSLADVRCTATGEQVYQMVKASLTGAHSGDNKDPVMNDFIEKVVNGMPLRGLVVLGQSGMSCGDLDAMIAVMNQE